jgi:hypothetical protein
MAHLFFPQATNTTGQLIDVIGVGQRQQQLQQQAQQQQFTQQLQQQQLGLQQSTQETAGGRLIFDQVQAERERQAAIEQARLKAEETTFQRGITGRRAAATELTARTGAAREQAAQQTAAEQARTDRETTERQDLIGSLTGELSAARNLFNRIPAGDERREIARQDLEITADRLSQQLGITGDTQQLKRVDDILDALDEDADDQTLTSLLDTLDLTKEQEGQIALARGLEREGISAALLKEVGFGSAAKLKFNEDLINLRNRLEAAKDKAQVDAAVGGIIELINSTVDEFGLSPLDVPELKESVFQQLGQVAVEGGADAVRRVLDETKLSEVRKPFFGKAKRKTPLPKDTKGQPILTDAELDELVGKNLK